MTFGPYNVDYEQRAYNPERMRKERLARDNGLKSEKMARFTHLTSFRSGVHQGKRIIY